MHIKLSSKHFIMISMGSMIGSGWLFSPYYGYQVAGVGVLLAWLLTGVIIGVIGLSFARVCASLPVVGGVYRMLTLTHNRDLAHIFLLVGWFSYLLHLPLEAQTAVQYLGFWWPQLVSGQGSEYQLSPAGAATAALIIVLLTWFNTLIVSKVSTANIVVSLWKMAIPTLVIALVIVGHGSWAQLHANAQSHGFSVEHVLLAISGSGLAFAFDGFQNGVVLAHHATEPKRAVVLSLFLPLLFCVLLYAALSLGFIAATNGPLQAHAVAPLLGLLATLGMAQGLSVVLFADAVVSPVGTVNVFTTVTARMLYSLALDASPRNWLRRLDPRGTPQIALWVDCTLALLMLLAFPTWTELVSVLTSALVLAYLVGPLSLLALHAQRGIASIAAQRSTPALATAAFVCCSWLVYWAGLTSLLLVAAALAVGVAGLCAYRQQAWQQVVASTWLLPAYMVSLSAVAWLHQHAMLPFPADNALVAAIGVVFCRAFVQQRLPDAAIANRLQAMRIEMAAEQPRGAAPAADCQR